MPDIDTTIGSSSAESGQQRVRLGKSQVSVAIPDGWQTDEVLCQRPCLTLSLIIGANAFFPRLSLDELPESPREGSLESYTEQLVSEWRPGSPLGRPRKVNIAGFPAIHVDMEGTMITDVVGYVGGGKVTNYRSALFVMQIDGVLYRCSLDARPDDVETFRGIHSSFCASVVLEQD